VLKSFFTRAGSGHFDIQNPERLARLMIGMTSNKLAFQRRRHYARRRESRLTDITPVEDIELAAARPGPSHLACDNDLFGSVAERLGDQEGQILDLRAKG
jgi:hypothetical protein